jgi:hypothetical protein
MDQKARKTTTTAFTAKSAKPPPPVQIRAAPPILRCSDTETYDLRASTRGHGQIRFCSQISREVKKPPPLIRNDAIARDARQRERTDARTSIAAMTMRAVRVIDRRTDHAPPPTAAILGLSTFVAHCRTTRRRRDRLSRPRCRALRKSQPCITGMHRSSGRRATTHPRGCSGNPQ